MEKTDITVDAAIDGPGKLFVISAPSGAGKTTLIKAVMPRFPRLNYSTSHTTRPPRAGEVHGKDYFFVAPEQFGELIEADEMLEWAEVHGNCYGTSKAFVMEKLAQGESILLDIDVQGARQVMASQLAMTSIFIMPPSLEVLEERLRARGTDSPEVIRERLDNAAGEMDRRFAYDHVVVNDVLEDAVETLCRILSGKGCGA